MLLKIIVTTSSFYQSTHRRIETKSFYILEGTWTFSLSWNFVCVEISKISKFVWRLVRKYPGTNYPASLEPDFTHHVKLGAFSQGWRWEFIHSYSWAFIPTLLSFWTTPAMSLFFPKASLSLRI